MDFAEFFVVEADKLIIEVDSLHRLDEERLAATAGAVDYAVDAALPADDDRNHKTIVADGDEILLQVLAMGFEETFEGFMDEMALLLAVAAEAAKVVVPPAVSRNATRSSPRSRMRFGGPSAVGSSLESSAAIQ